MQENIDKIDFIILSAFDKLRNDLVTQNLNGTLHTHVEKTFNQGEIVGSWLLAIRMQESVTYDDYACTVSFSLQTSPHWLKIAKSAGTRYYYLWADISKGNDKFIYSFPEIIIRQLDELTVEIIQAFGLHLLRFVPQIVFELQSSV